MRIAICDDDVHDLFSISSLIVDYGKSKRAEADTITFQSGTDLLDVLERGERYDLLLLDIVMPGVDGIQTAKDIRAFDSTVKIVFLTFHQEFALQGYAVQAYHYLIKPATAQNLSPILDRAFADVQEPEDCLTIHAKSSIMRVPFRRIVYAEIVGRTVYFHLTDGTTREVCASFASLENQLLSHFGFVKTHRSYIANMRWIREIEIKNILMTSGQRVPVSRKSLAPVRAAYIEYLFVTNRMD